MFLEGNESSVSYFPPFQSITGEYDKTNSTCDLRSGEPDIAELTALIFSDSSEVLNESHNVLSINEKQNRAA
jgi:hypothetical protein